MFPTQANELMFQPGESWPGQSPEPSENKEANPGTFVQAAAGGWPGALLGAERDFPNPSLPAPPSPPPNAKQANSSLSEVLIVTF